MKQIDDTLLHYQDSKGAHCRCRLRVYESRQGIVVIATESHDPKNRYFNPGSSITVTAEILANHATYIYKRPVAMWFENYLRPHEEFELVQFLLSHDGKYFSPAWEPTSRAEVEMLVGKLD